MTCFGEMCLQGISTVGVCWQSVYLKDVLARENWGCACRGDICAFSCNSCFLREQMAAGRTGDVHAEETFVRFLVIVVFLREQMAADGLRWRPFFRKK